MKPRKKVEETIKRRLLFTAASTWRERLLEKMVHAQEQAEETAPALHEPVIGRFIMRSPIVKSVAAAAVIAVALLALSFWGRMTTPAYALDDTVEALKNIRFLHIVERDDQGRIEDERWIEIGMNGWQVRYRQDSPPHHVAIEDGESTAVYRNDRNAVILYDREDLQYQWVGELGKAFENLRQEGTILEENGEYQGRPAHKVWWPYLSAECYVDPQTKLPIAIGASELSYEEPPAGTFDIIIPDGYAVADKRPGATTPLPEWLQEEESIQRTANESFGQATRALAQGEYAEAAKLFEYVVEHQAGRNWAWFWLGSAYYELGQYDLAIGKFTKVLEIFNAYGGGGKEPLGYCNYARGLAYARLGMQSEAVSDLQVCLPAMIRTLRIPSAGTMFEYADNPLIRYGEYKPTDQEIVAKMINRLRLITGQNFGYDPEATPEQNEAAVAAWEQWLATDGSIKFTPDAERIAVPTAKSPR